MTKEKQAAAISKWKASLSEYLARVKAGEEVVVTEGGSLSPRLFPLIEGVQRSPLIL
jgi:antitoxin (DNA-binding transcriptional repressor) of toxin-antitoxin stability system